MKHTSSGGNLIMIGLYSGKYFFRIRGESFYGPDAHTGEWIHLVLTAYKEVAGPTSIERVSLYVNGTYIDQYAMLTEVGDVSGGRAWTIGPQRVSETNHCPQTAGSNAIAPSAQKSTHTPHPSQAIVSTPFIPHHHPSRNQDGQRLEPPSIWWTPLLSSVRSREVFDDKSAS